MPTVASIMADFAALSTSDKLIVKSRLISYKATTSASLDSFVAENRFSGGLVCPECGGIHVVRNGHRNGTQRYLCKGCGKSFVATTKSITAGSKKDLSTWDKFIECMIGHLSVRDAALECGIHRNTAFAWRHKVLGALQNMAESVVLDGIVEADETFFPVSYKGNHKKGSFVMPRKAHHRGMSAKHRGISHEKVCVPCAVNRKGLSIAKASNLGRVATKNLHTVYDGRIKSGTTMVTDLMNSYRRFANKNGLDLIQLKGGKSKKGIYNIQHINSYHNELKHFMYGFRGVSSKHLNNYLIWHNFVNYALENRHEKQSILMRFALTQYLTIPSDSIAKKPVLPCVV